MIADDAIAHPDARVAESARVWGGSVLLPGSRVGEQVVISRNVYIGADVIIGDRCKVKDMSLLYEGSVLEDGVFIGPACVLTNDKTPRAVNPDGSLKSAEDWEQVGVTLRTGASLGARTVCVAPVTVGRWAMVAAGSVVSRDVPDFALMVGSPARQVGWVGRAGVRLREDAPGQYTCPRTGERYLMTDGIMRLGEDQ
jgi:acetyltransferase-like isoleucine patch superfamily enzyme